VYRDRDSKSKDEDKMDVAEPSRGAEMKPLESSKDDQIIDVTADSRRATSADLSPWSESSNKLMRNFFSRDIDEQNFKVDETDQAVTVSSTWNGFDKADLKVDFVDGALVIAGKSRVEAKDEKSGTVSRSYKSVSRSIPLPENINKEGIRAKFKDNTSTLTIEVPKLPKEKEVRKGGNIPIH
jgi:HSP20 family protein